MATKIIFKVKLSLFLAALLIIMGTVRNTEAIPCQEAVAFIAPCINYLKGGIPGWPNPFCCSACHRLQGLVTSVEDKKETCKCFKRAAPSVGVKADRAKLLPEVCQVGLGFAITPDIDCDKIKNEG
ncbi:hypothetical protein Droror1_Dr00005587 [Drosera rotundifolia]